VLDDRILPQFRARLQTRRNVPNSNDPHSRSRIGSVKGTRQPLLD